MAVTTSPEESEGVAVEMARMYSLSCSGDTPDSSLYGHPHLTNYTISHNGNILDTGTCMEQRWAIYMIIMQYDNTIQHTHHSPEGLAAAAVLHRDVPVL